MLNDSMRVLAFVIGGLVFLGGVALLETGTDAGAGVWSIALGAGFMIVAVLQRSRYRSDEAERSHADPGPGGGEPDTMEPRFAPTTEVFVDPTTRRTMRVFVDPRTGERRYRAER